MHIKYLAKCKINKETKNQHSKLQAYDQGIEMQKLELGKLDIGRSFHDFQDDSNIKVSAAKSKT